MSVAITIGATHEQARGLADFMDGKSADVLTCPVGIDDSDTPPELVIAPPGRAWHRWPLAEIRMPGEQATREELVLTRAGDSAPRLIVRDPELIRVLRARCPNLHRRPPARGKARLLLWSVGAIGAVALIIFVLVPAMADRLAHYLPPEGEKALGETTYQQIRSALDETGIAPLRECTSSRGLAALSAMQKRLTQTMDLPYPVTVHVLDHEFVNAAALPGGLVILFRGLLEAADSPDEVASVLAHELGHVAARDPARIALRSAGSIGVLGLLLGDFAGGAVVLFLTERLIRANYSQQAEAQADEFAHKALIDAGIPPSALADIFGRLRAKYGDADGFTAHFLSHPGLGDRIEKARAADEDMLGALRPSLSDSEWHALQRICDRG